MIHNIPKHQEAEEVKNIKAAMWANRIMTKKINNATCKYEIAQSTSRDLIEDMEQRVRLYLKVGLVTAEAFIQPVDSQLNRLRQAVRSKPLPATQNTNGSSDGLWSKKL